MHRAKCPLCKGYVITVYDKDHFGIKGVILAGHTPSRFTGPRDTVTHIGHGAGMCLGSGLTVKFAQGVAADRAEGRHLAAHP